VKPALKPAPPPAALGSAKMSESPVTRQALRLLRDKVDQRFSRLLQHYTALVYAIPGAEDFSLPPPRPAPIPGESPAQYRQRIATGFLRRARVLRRDISSYFFYLSQIDRQAIFTFVPLAPRLVFQESWVQDQIFTWMEVGEEQSLLKLFGLYKGRRSPQHKVEQHVLYGLVHAAVDYLCEQGGHSIQSALAHLAEQPIEFTLDGERRS